MKSVMLSFALMSTIARTVTDFEKFPNNACGGLTSDLTPYNAHGAFPTISVVENDEQCLILCRANNKCGAAQVLQYHRKGLPQLWCQLFRMAYNNLQFWRDRVRSEMSFANCYIVLPELRDTDVSYEPKTTRSLHAQREKIRRLSPRTEYTGCDEDDWMEQGFSIDKEVVRTDVLALRHSQHPCHCNQLCHKMKVCGGFVFFVDVSGRKVDSGVCVLYGKGGELAPTDGNPKLDKTVSVAYLVQ